MKIKLKWILGGLLVPSLVLAATFPLFQPATGILKGNANTYVTTAATGADIPAAGANTQVQYNNLGALGASSSFTFTSASNVLTLGAATTPGTFSVGQLDSMVVNGVAVPIPGFSINSNIQGVIENHSYVSGGPTGGARYYGVRSRGSITTPAIVQSGDNLNTIFAAGYNGTNYSLAGEILFTVGNTPGAADMPGDIDFLLSPDGSQTPQTRLKLFNTGAIGISGSQGTSGQVLTSSGTGAAASWATLPGSFTGFANPTASVGLTAVNGAATTAMRSDAAPALSQSIAPTWTGTHTFSTSNAQIVMTNGSAGANAKNTLFRTSTAGTLALSSSTDATPTTAVTDLLAATRSGSAWGAVSFGNATDNPTYAFLGTGSTTFNGSPLVQFTPNPFIQLQDTAGTANQKNTLIRLGGSPASNFQVCSATDAAPTTPVTCDITTTRSGSAWTTINLGNTTDNPAFTVNNVTLTPLSGSFVVTFDDACTTSPTATFTYLKVGVVVNLSITAASGFGCTGDSANFASTGAPIPAALRPTNNTADFRIMAGFTDNGAAAAGVINYTAAGNIAFSRVSGGTSVTTWTAAGSRSIPASQMTGLSYMTNN